MPCRLLIPFFITCLIVLISCNTEKEELPDKGEQAIQISVPQGFELEELYHPSAHGQGSWVALAQGPDDTFFASDQNGSLYSFKRPAIGEVLDSTQVRPLALPIGSAHGLIWAFNSLYVAVNKSWEADGVTHGSGIYRVTDSDADGTLETITSLIRLEGAGEHGPHSFVMGPNGKNLYFVAGNHTLIPESLKNNSRLPSNWGEDHLFPAYKDARGHAADIKAPGGWIARFNEDGSEWELISAGYRNPFDLAFTPSGELFAYDSDMEWDIGMPWYRPTRICHVTSGSEFGWRTGSGKWPEYYPDNLPGVISMAQGSPTGVISGAALDFPDKFKTGLFVADWSFGTLYYIDLIPSGSSYSATKQEFLSGTPLPLTDLIAGSDGQLYFATGGRDLDSHLYRLRYTGTVKNPDQLAMDDSLAPLRQLRRRLEGYHGAGHEQAIPYIWEQLGHQDRHIRYAARIALEHQPVASWAPLFQNEKETEKTINAGLALVRQGEGNLLPLVMAKLTALEFGNLSREQQLGLLRTYALAFIRMGPPDQEYRKAVIESLQRYYPHASPHINREISQLLLYLNADGIVAELVGILEKQMEKKIVPEDLMLDEEVTYRSEQYGPAIREVLENTPATEAIWYGMLLSHAGQGWTDALRERYFSWFYEVLSASGGMSFKAYMENVRVKAMHHVPEHQKAHMQELSGVYSPTEIIADLPQPKGPGAEYSATDLQDILWGERMNPYTGTPADGKRAYDAALCVMCHRMNGEGGVTGPDLSQVHTKFGSYDLLFAIFSPNDAISDQYAFTLFYLDNGQRLAGRILSEEGDSIEVAPNPLNTSYTVKVSKAQVVDREQSPISPMPSALLNRLNPQEIADLFAYLLSGADPAHELYSQQDPSE